MREHNWLGGDIMFETTAKFLAATMLVFLAGCSEPSNPITAPVKSEEQPTSTATAQAPVAVADSTEGWPVTANREIVRAYLDKSGIGTQVEIAYTDHLNTLTDFLKFFEAEEKVDLDVESLANFLTPEQVLARVEKYMSHFMQQTLIASELEFLESTEGIVTTRTAMSYFSQKQIDLRSDKNAEADLRRLISPKRNLVMPTRSITDSEATPLEVQYRSAMVYVADTLGNELYRMNQQLNELL